MAMFLDSIEWLRSQIGKGKRFPSTLQMAKFLGLDEKKRTALYNALKGSVPASDNLMAWLDSLGARISLLGPGPVDTTRNVLFAAAQPVSVNGNVPLPDSEDYLAVPLVGEAGAGPGIVHKEEIESWIMVYKHHKSVQRRRNLIAVEIGKNQLSMVPTLYPGDIVLVDRDTFEPSSFRELFLVRERGQEGGGGKVKRVTLNGRGDSTIITFSSDNVDGGFQPESMPLREYEGGVREAIIGKCVWGWTDLSGK